ncbi:hypothetical protein DCO58_01590 [Helicobacter saguini]|uniref:Uncharacterized protein n=1 Tax=Helicobacter saguini TaxID=1548018 RepID=A0A347VRF0_9HELI|nr:hypothetical protein [Helicobacter saguini]MWV62925.1 hypothetical protein [Helicobacter saguini]MWV66405.1 hypothetical protein [Helicobacter saguini]MWV68757.1 hypothetical protein [Helicobacter saguini]MWV71690.1 hypothetical protein [Helicobacter saguini]TLD91874.1 hypothetical protein LS64_011160 [Helicobacter saguini]
MRFFKLKFRKGDIFVIPLCIVMFGGWYYFLTKDYAKEQDKQLANRLDKLAKDCRGGDQKSCDIYIEILNKSYKD